MRMKSGLAAAAMLLLAGAAFAEPGKTGTPTPISMADAAVLFGAREGVTQISLSPDGTQIAYIAPLAGQAAVLVVRGTADDAKPRAIMQASGKPERLGGCHWVSNGRLACTIYGVVDVEGRKVDFTRMFALDTDGGNVKELSRRTNANTRGIALGGGAVIDWLPQEDGAVLMTRVYLPDDHTGSRIGSIAEGLGVDRVDTRTLAVRVVEPANPDAVEYIADGRGTVRIMGLGSTAVGLSTGIVRYSYRRPGSRHWEALSTYNSNTDEGFNPYAVDHDQNVAYGLKKSDGRDVLYSVSLDGSLKETRLFGRPDADIDGLSRIGRNRRVIGADYQTDAPEVHYFDPDINHLAEALAHAVPSQPNIRVVDASSDERKLLIFAGSDDDPGVYYLLDRDRRDLHILLSVRPALVGKALGKMTAVHYSAADGTDIPAYLTLPPGRQNAKGLPAIVMPHGGPSYRDEWGFDWLPQFFAARGYAVLQPEFRGSAGYGDAWYQKNGFRSWRIAIGDVTDAGRWLVAKGIADPAKLAIVGWSYGGYAALQSAAIAPDLFKAVVAVAPVTDLATLKAESQGWSDSEVVRTFIGGGAEAQAGSPAQNAAKIKAPVLLVHGTDDANVGYHESALMAAKLRGAGDKVQLITFDGLDHQLDDSGARRKLLEQADAFLRGATGG